MPLRAVFFDVGETLLAPYPSFGELFSEIMGGLGYEVTPGDVEEALATVAPSVGEAIGQAKTTWSTSREASRRFWRDLYGTMLAHWGIDDASGAIFDVIYGRFTSYESYRLFPDVIPTLTACRGAGLKLGIVSNFEEWLEGLLIEMEVAPFFAFMVISGKEGVEKPDPAIFRLALERSGVAPEDAVFVGDHPRLDVAAASELGMTGVLIDRPGRYPDFEGLRIERLTDLLPLLEAPLA
ncbi:MAG TPA: HAD-IA family hydrolase [Actinomycetota bacterium]|nr:HAD-IA family hydrolase [Actinomycetota bacterium]